MVILLIIIRHPGGGPDASSLSVYGTRFIQWYYDGFVDVDDMIEAKWGRRYHC